MSSNSTVVMPAWEAMTSSTRPCSPALASAFMSPSMAAWKGCLPFHSGCVEASSLTRSRAKTSWTYIGCSHQSVPSLSKVAMRCSGGTKSGLPSAVTLATKSVIARFVAPSFQDGSGSRDVCADAGAERSTPDKVGRSAKDENTKRRLTLKGLFELIFRTLTRAFTQKIANDVGPRCQQPASSFQRPTFEQLPRGAKIAEVIDGSLRWRER